MPRYKQVSSAMGRALLTIGVLALLALALAEQPRDAPPTREKQGTTVAEMEEQMLRKPIKKPQPSIEPIIVLVTVLAIAKIRRRPLRTALPP